MDVLDELDQINLCVAYELNGKKIDYFPAAVQDQLNVKPVFKKFEGWKSKTQGIKKFDELNKENAQHGLVKHNRKYIYEP